MNLLKLKSGDASSAQWKRLSLDNPLIRSALIVAFLLGAVLALHDPGSRGQPDLERFSIGASAPWTVHASHGFHWERAATRSVEVAIQEAGDAVRPVLDHDVDAKEVIVGRIAAAFRAMRRNLRLAAWEKRSTQISVDADDGEQEAPIDLASLERELDYAEWISVLTPHEREELLNNEAVLEELVRHLQRSVRPEVRAALAREGFREDLEMLTRRIVTIAMDRPIVSDRAVVEATARDGLTLRARSRHDTLNERPLRDLNAVSGQDQIPEIVDRTAAIELSSIDDARLAEAIRRLAESLITPNAALNQEETEARRAERQRAARAAARLSRDIRQGEVLVAAGETVTEEILSMLVRHEATRPIGRSWGLHAFGLALLIGLLVFPILLFSRRNLRDFTRDRRDLVMMGSLLVLHLLLTRMAIHVSVLVVEEGGTLPVEAFYVLVPFATGAMTVRALSSAESSLIYAVTYSLLAGFLFGFDVTYVAYALVAGIAGSAAVGGAQSRTEIMRAGLYVGVAMAGVAIGLGLVGGQVRAMDVLYIAIFALFSGALSAVLVNAILPLFETLFRYTTSFRLLELANLNHPAMRELILHAPGSYHHSIMVGQLVEAACEAVGANALLGRVGAYYHDIGKGKNPHYFAENQHGDNPHDKLKPSVSALILKKHVKDGLELAHQHKLPPEIIDFILEHHGTSVIEFFYKRACDELGEENVSKEDYRYPGPKPQSRETAICLLADGIEAASRTLRDPSQARIAGLVNRMINRAFTSGELEECDLTLKDLNLIAEAFIRRLTAFYHHRPEYPGDPRKSQGPRPKRTGETPLPPTSAPQPPDDPSADHADSSPAPDDGPAEVAGDDDPITLRRLGL